MSEVKLVVGGRNYTLACQDGEEDHVRKLAGMIDERLTAMGSNLTSFEGQNLLFAALFLADELTEAKKSSAAPTAAATPPADQEKIAGALEKIADRLETTAKPLERG